MLARLKRFSFISIPNDRQFVKRVSEKILMDLAILRGICSLRAEKTFFHGILGGKSSLEARLRTRKVGRAFMLLPRAAFWCFAEAFVCSPKLSVKNLFSYPHPAILALPRSPFHHTRAPPAVRTHNKRLYHPIRPEVRRSQVYHRRQRINLNVSQIVPAEQ